MSIPPSELENTIRRAIEGDNDAIARLYQVYVERIYRYVVFRAPQHDAEDITAEVFVKMVEGLPRYNQTGAPFEAWLYRIASARINDYYRRHRRGEQVELSDQMPDQDWQPEEEMLQAQEIGNLRDVLQELTEEQQAVLVLRFVERKSHEEVAALLGKSIAAVKTTQHRALTRLSKLLDAGGKARHYLRGHDE